MNLRLQPVTAQRNDGSQVEHIFSAWIALVALAACPLLMLFATHDPGYSLSSTSLALHLGLVIYPAVRLLQIVVLGRPDWFRLFFWVFSYVWMGLAGLIQVISGRTPFTYLTIPNGIVAPLIVFCGYAGYDIGSVLSSSRQTHRDAGHPPSRAIGRVIATGRLRILSYSSICTFPVLFVLRGGWHGIVGSRQAASSALAANGLITSSSKVGGGIVVSVSNVLPFVALLGWLIVRNSRPLLPRERRLMALVGLETALFSNPLGSSRYWVLTVLLGLLLVRPRFQTTTGVRLAMSSFVLFSVVLFPYLDYFRTSSHAISAGNPLTQMETKPDFDAFAQIENGVSYVNDQGYQMGSQLSGAVLFAVPRAVWNGKAEDTGTVLARFIRWPNTNLSAPLWIELYVDFSWPGVLAGFVALGYVSARLDADSRRLRVLKGTNVAVLRAAGPALAVFLVLVLRGSLLQATGTGVVLLFGFWAISQADTFTRQAPAYNRPAPLKISKDG